MSKRIFPVIYAIFTLYILLVFIALLCFHVSYLCFDFKVVILVMNSDIQFDFDYRLKC